MFWISLTGIAKEAKEYEYTLKLRNKDGADILAFKKTECLSCDMSSDDVKKKATVLFVSRDDVKQADTDEKKLEWKVLIKKK